MGQVQRPPGSSVLCSSASPQQDPPAHLIFPCGPVWQEFSDESDQEDDGELYANNSAPTMELPPKPVVPGAPTPVPDVAVADALASEEPAAQEVLDTSSLPPTDEPQASLPESEMKSDDDALPAAAAPTAAPPLVSSDSAPQPSNVDSVAGEPSTTAASLAPPPSAPQPSSPLSPAASSPLSIAPSPFPTASTPAASTQAEEKQDDPSPVSGQAHPLPGVEGEMALTGEDGSDPRSAGAQIGMGVPALEDQPMDDA